MYKRQEVTGELSAAGVAELAWSTGLITWEENPKPGWYDACLLYTSDAADDLLCVDLGGRRIIKKKNHEP